MFFYFVVDFDEFWELEVFFDDVLVFEWLFELLLVMILMCSYCVGGEDFVELINDVFYGGEIVLLLWVGFYFGCGSFMVDYVEGGMGIFDLILGVVESLDVEVVRVVIFVVEYVVYWFVEFFMVVIVSVWYVECVCVVVIVVFVGCFDVVDFVGWDMVELFVVLMFEEFVVESCDWVIFLFGFGFMKYGCVLSDFGDLFIFDGEWLFMVGMMCVCWLMVIVFLICFFLFDDGCFEYGVVMFMLIFGGLVVCGRDVRFEDFVDLFIFVLVCEL